MSKKKKSNKSKNNNKTIVVNESTSNYNNDNINNISKILNTKGTTVLTSSVLKNARGSKFYTGSTPEEKRKRILWTLIEAFVMSFCLNAVLFAFFNTPILLPDLTSDASINSFIRIIVRFFLCFSVISIFNIYITENSLKKYNTKNK